MTKKTAADIFIENYIDSETGNSEIIFIDDLIKTHGNMFMSNNGCQWARKNSKLTNNYNFKSYDARVNMIIDNEIDNIKVEVRYDETFFRLNLEERTEEDSDQNKKIYYSFDYRHNSKNRKRIYNLIKKSIKDKKIYDYEDALTPVVNIYVNQTNSDLVTVDGTYID